MVVQVTIPPLRWVPDLLPTKTKENTYYRAKVRRLSNTDSYIERADEIDKWFLNEITPLNKMVLKVLQALDERECFLKKLRVHYKNMKCKYYLTKDKKDLAYGLKLDKIFAKHIDCNRKDKATVFILEKKIQNIFDEMEDHTYVLNKSAGFYVEKENIVIKVTEFEEFEET